MPGGMAMMRDVTRRPLQVISNSNWKTGSLAVDQQSGMYCFGWELDRYEPPVERTKGRRWSIPAAIKKGHNAHTSRNANTTSSRSSCMVSVRIVPETVVSQSPSYRAADNSPRPMAIPGCAFGGDDEPEGTTGDTWRASRGSST